VSQIAYIVFLFLCFCQMQTLAIHALRYSKIAKQCINSSLFPLLLYDFSASSNMGLDTEILKQKPLTLMEPPLVQVLPCFLDLVILNRIHSGSVTVH
jgi:hypothetical protein